jgi:hypothetical protein
MPREHKGCNVGRTYVSSQPISDLLRMTPHVSEDRDGDMDRVAVPGRIFVSYRRDDSAYPTGWLTDRLVERYGQSQVFADVDSIELGDNFAKKITAAVASCEVLLAVIGPKWLTVEDENGRRRLDDPSDYVRIEIEAALRRQILVVPILVDGANMPRVSDLPGKPTRAGGEPEQDSLATLPYREALTLHPDQFDWAVGRLLKKLDEVLSHAATHRVGQPTPLPSPESEPEPDLDPEPRHPTDLEGAAFGGALRWGLIGVLVAATALTFLVLPVVFEDVRSARKYQPQATAWIAFVWLLPGFAALASLACAIANRASTVGQMFGFTVASAWMVADSWALLDARSQPPHSAINATMVFLLSAAAIGTATSALLRQRVQSNHPFLMMVALCLAIGGFLIHTQARVLAKALSDDSATPVPWALQSDSWMAPFVVCVIAASIKGNGHQTQALRTCVGVIVLYDVGIRAASLYKALSEGQVPSAATLVESLLVVSGSVLLWWAVCVGQPKTRMARRPRRARPAAAMP